MIARKSALIVATKILDGGLGYLGLFFIARYMSPADYGIVSFAMGFVALFSIFSTLGFPSAHIKRISEGKNLGRCIGTFLSIRAVFIITSIAILFGSLFFWTNVMGRGFESPDHLAAIYIITGYWLASQIITSFSTTFQAQKKMAKNQIPFLINGIVRTAAIIYVALSGYGALALAWTYVAGEIAQLVLVLFFSRKYPIKKPTKEYIKSYSIFAFPLAISSVSSTVMKNIDKVLIQLFWTSADVGYYFAAFQLSHVITMFTSAIASLIFPTYSSLHAKNNIAQIKKLTFDSERHLSLIVFPMVFGLIILAEPTAFILLSGWMPAVPLLQILPFTVLFKTLSTPYSTQFNGMNKPQITRNMVIIEVICNISLNFLLIPKDIQMLGGIKLFGLGATGAAIATAASFAVGLIYTRIMAYKLTKSKGNKRILIHAFAALGMTGVLYLVLYHFSIIVLITRWYHLLAFAALGLVIYLGILALFKEFTKEDFYFYLDTLSIRKMGQYIKEELRHK
jgi:O-antigen/teichoic acid export membrane protein